MINLLDTKASVNSKGTFKSSATFLGIIALLGDPKKHALNLEQTM